MESRNMAGLTEAEIRRRLRERGACAVVAAGCAAGASLIALGVALNAACVRWPVLCDRLPPLGFMGLGAAAHVVWRGWRDGRCGHAD